MLALCVLLLGALVSTLPAGAQAVYGSLFGTVTDKTGAAIPNATITVLDVSKGITVTTKTNASGAYLVQHLIPDTYQVTAEVNGFTKQVVNNVVVFADTTPEVNLKLAVGAATTTIVVEAGASTLQVERPDVATVIDDKLVEDLPNFNRNLTAFELMTPGTNYVGWGGGEGGGNPQRSEAIEVQGQLPWATGYELDGTDNRDPLNGQEVINPDPDSVSEVKITVSNFDAEYGNGVAGIVTAQTKSGTNKFHGSAYDSYRSNAWMATDPFGGKVSPGLQSQFGGTVGGPAIKNKLFFFADYTGLRSSGGAPPALFTVPTALAQSTCGTSAQYCDLSDYLPANQVYHHDSTFDGLDAPVAYAGNLIPNSVLSPAAVKLFQDLPKPSPNLTGIFDNYQGHGQGSFNTDAPTGRVDWNPTDKLHVFGRYTYFGGTIYGTPVFGAAGGAGFGAGGFAGNDKFHFNSLASGGDYVLSTKWLTDFRFAYYSIYNQTTGPDATSPAGNDLGIPNANLTPFSTYGGLPQFSITLPGTSGANNGGGESLGSTTLLNLQDTKQYQIVDNWTHTMGNHNIRFGADWRLNQNSSLSPAGNGNVNFSGNYFFSNTRTSDGASNGLGWATFLMGDVTRYWRSVINNSGSSSQPKLFFYGQDTWRVNSKLTLNYGVRWDMYFPERVPGAGKGGLLDLEHCNPICYINIAGVGGISNTAGVKANYGNWAPRLGASYQLNAKTVIRAGFGTTYGQGWAGNLYGSVLTVTPPLEAEQDLEPANNNAAIFNLTGTGTLGGNAVVAGPPGYTFAPIPSNGKLVLTDGTSVNTRPMKVRLPTVQGWNLTIQRELGAKFSVQAAYVGSEAYHNMFDSSNQYGANEATNVGYTQGASINDRKPYWNGLAQSNYGVNYGSAQGWSQGIGNNWNMATESYNSLQLVATMRATRGLSFFSNYTWSHAIDHESYFFSIDPTIGKGNSYYNRTQQFNFNGTYDLPFGKGKQYASGVSEMADRVVGGWQISAVWGLSSGIPFTACYAEVASINDVANNDGCGPSFVNKVPGTSFNLKKGKFDPINKRVHYMPTSPLPFEGAYVYSGAGTCSNGSTPDPGVYICPAGNNPSSWGPYAEPAPGTFGNLRRDSLFGPARSNVDATLGKTTQIWEGLKLKLEFQAYNVFNHANLGTPNSTVDGSDSSNAGYIQSTVGTPVGIPTSMRMIQFAAHFQF
jgi:outer membrane receptor protein involved in Fe transport